MKGAALAALILLLLLLPGSRHSAHSAATPVGLIGMGAIIVALRAIKNTYDGWNNCVYFSEEMQAPERQIPRALFGGIALVTSLYVLVNVAILHALPLAAVANSNLPVADALGADLGNWAGVLLTGLGIISVGAILNLNVMFGPRIALAMARDGVLPTAVSRIGTGGVPRLALATTSILAAALAATGTYEQLLAFNVAIGTLTDVLVCLSVVQLRRIEPNLPRPWRTPLYPVPIIAAACINVALLGGLLYEDPIHSLAGVGAAVLIGVGYHVKKRTLDQLARALAAPWSLKVWHTPGMVRAIRGVRL